MSRLASPDTSPNFTAFVVASAQLALRKYPAWQRLVPDASAAVYEVCVRACVRKRLQFQLLDALPERLKIRLLERATAFGYALHMALRKQAIEIQARSDIQRGVQQLVVIGAGFDALCLRLSREFPQLRCIEIDLPGTQELKHGALARAGVAFPSNLTFLPGDMSTRGLGGVLSVCEAFTPQAPTLFIAEGLSMYLTEKENRGWLADIRALCGGEARLLFTAIETTAGADALGRAVRDRFLKKNHARFQWSLPAEAMEGFLEESGFALKYTRTYADLQRPHRTEADYERLKHQPGEHVYYAAGKG